MTGSEVVAATAAVLALLAIADFIADVDSRAGRMGELFSRSPLSRLSAARGMAARLDLEARLRRAGWSGRVTVQGLLVCKAVTALLGLFAGLITAPAAPGRLAWVVLAGMPVAGFIGPDAMLEREARRRLARLRAALPDALDVVAVGAAAGRTPLASFGELAAGDGPLARELGITAAEAGCGLPQRRALAGLRERVPGTEVAAVCAAIERSQRHGSPLADQLRRQAGALRVRERRRIEERAAKAAPKIQLVVALVLVPSVLLMIGAALIVNVDQFLAGF